jgi:hypothetical protein
VDGRLRDFGDAAGSRGLRDGDRLFRWRTRAPSRGTATPPTLRTPLEERAEAAARVRRRRVYDDDDDDDALDLT